MAKKKATPSRDEEPIETEPDLEAEETVQTVQEEQTRSQREPYFEMAKDADGQWAWCLWSGNGRMMATSAITYTQANDCKSAIQTINGKLGGKLKIVVAHEE